MGRGVDWDAALRKCYEAWPMLKDIDWNAEMMEVEVAVSVIKDVLSHSPDKTGPRYKPGGAEGVAAVRQLIDPEYTNEPFTVAVRRLMERRGLSERALCKSLPMSRATAQRIISGAVPPRVWEMQEFAKRFDLLGEYFVEYRTAMIAGLLIKKLSEDPERSATLAYKLSRGLVNG